MSKAVAYFPGCSLHGSATELDSSFLASAASLGVQLIEIPDWSCCGNTAIHSANRLLAAALPAHELVKVEQDMRLDTVAIPCAGCFNRFAVGHLETQEPDTGPQIEAVVGRRYQGGVAVHNLVDFYYSDVGLGALARAVVQPFTGLKVACYYGCLLTRPPRATLAEDPEYPMRMDEVVEVLGCEAVQWNAKTDCCGSSLALCEVSTVLRMVTSILQDARACGAQAVVVACPLCQVNLDAPQPEIAKLLGDWRPLPVLYLSQLVGLAVGVPRPRLGLNKLIVDPSPLLR